MKLSEITPIQILGGVLVVNTVLVGGVAQLTDLFGATMANHILNACILGSGICGGFIMNMGGLGTQARNVVNGGASIAVGPYATTSLATLAMDPAQSKIDAAPGAGAAVAAIAKAAAVILVAFALSALLIPGDAQAQTRKLAAPAVTGDLKKDLQTDGQNLGIIPPSLQVTPTGNPGKDLQAIWDKIITASSTDLTYASKLAASANTPASGIRKQCWDAIITINNQASGLNLKNADGTPMTKPDPHVFTDVETLAEVVDNLSPSGPLFTSCAGAAQLAKTNVLTFVNAVVTGAAGIAAMPVIPGL